MAPSRGNRKNRTWRFVALSALAVVALVSAFLAATLPGSNSAASGPATPLPTLAVTDSRPLTVFLGGSSTAGEDASDQAKRWTSILSASKNWKESNLGVAGAGYVTSPDPSACGKAKCPAIQDVVAAAVATGARVVVVAGGEADTDQKAATEAKAVASTFSRLRAGLPDALIVAVGPYSSDVIPSSSIQAIDGLVQAAATSVGATYVSLLGAGVLDQTMFTPKGQLNDRGHAATAAQVAAAVK